MSLLLSIARPLVATTLLAAALAGQNARPTVQLDPGLTGPNVAPSIATDGELTAVVFNVVTAPHQIFVATSDGRGTTWSAPVRIDDDASGATKLSGPLVGTATKNLHVDGDHIYAVWRDNRNAASSTRTDVYFTRSTDRGVTWDANTRIDNSVAPGAGDVRDWIMEVSGDYVYVLISVDPDDLSDEELWLTTSTDAGVTFGAAVSVTPTNGAAVDIEDIGLAADGANVYIAWADDRSTVDDDIFFTRSADAGQTFSGDLKVNSSPLGVGDANDTTHVKVSGSLVFVAWQEELADAANEELRGALSTDGGLTFGPDFQIGNYTAGTHDTDLAWIEIVAGVPLACWEDDRTGIDEVYAARSTDGGATWNETQLGTGGQFPRFARSAEDPNDPNVVVAFSTSGSAGTAVVALSRDAGATWTPAVTVSASVADVDNTEVAYNALYGNAISAFLANDLGSNNVYAGGFRPQTITPTSVTSGASVNFALTGWLDGTPRLAWVLGSNQPGVFPLPFGDGRDLGLTLDGTFLATLGDPGSFLTVLDPTGTAATGSFPLLLPPGTTFYAAAVSFDLGPVTFVEVTDALEITVE